MLMWQAGALHEVAYKKSSSSNKSSYILIKHRYFKKSKEHIECKTYNIQVNCVREEKEKKERCIQSNR